MIQLRVDEAAAIPLAVESASPVSMTVKEEFIDRGGASIQSNKNATPGTAAVEVTPDPGYDAMAKVTVEAVPQGALSPIDIDFDDSTGAFTAEARVGTSGYIPDSAFVGGGFQLATQAAATITPTTVQQQAVAAHKYTTGAVVVDPIPAEYIIPSGTKNITANGNAQDVKAYEKVNVSVPNSYSASDEGKVVSSGALVAQTSQTIDENGTYDTTLKNEVVVDVQGGGGIAMVEGDFTIASETAYNSPTITHNLGTQKIGVLIYPKTTIAPADIYRVLHVEFINTNAICDGQTWVFDFSRYSTALTTPVSIPIPSDKLDVGYTMIAPTKTSADWSNANPSYCHQRSGSYALTDNTFKYNGGGYSNRFPVGTYHYIIWKLG